jgi:hypothetical protein
MRSRSKTEVAPKTYSLKLSGRPSTVIVERGREPPRKASDAFQHLLHAVARRFRPQRLPGDDDHRGRRLRHRALHALAGHGHWAQDDRHLLRRGASDRAADRRAQPRRRPPPDGGAQAPPASPSHDDSSTSIIFCSPGLFDVIEKTSPKA